MTVKGEFTSRVVNCAAFHAQLRYFSRACFNHNQARASTLCGQRGAD